MHEIDQEVMLRSQPVQQLREPHPRQQIIDRASVVTLLEGSGKVPLILTEDEHRKAIGWLRSMKKHVHPLEALEIAELLDKLALASSI